MGDERKSLKINELFSIMKWCRKYGVLNIDYMGLHLSFDKEAEFLYKEAKAKKVSPKLIAQVEGEELLDQEVKVRQSQLEQMIIEDPQGYEKLLAEGELGGNVEPENNGTEQGIS